MAEGDDASVAILKALKYNPRGLTPHYSSFTAPLNATLRGLMLPVDVFPYRAVKPSP
jgi:hypothetical protein